MLKKSISQLHFKQWNIQEVLEGHRLKAFKASNGFKEKENKAFGRLPCFVNVHEKRVVRSIFTLSCTLFSTL